jgi:hypothetical protein
MQQTRKSNKHCIKIENQTKLHRDEIVKDKKKEKPNIRENKKK